MVAAAYERESPSSSRPTCEPGPSSCRGRLLSCWCACSRCRLVAFGRNLARSAGFRRRSVGRRRLLDLRCRLGSSKRRFGLGELLLPLLVGLAVCAQLVLGAATVTASSAGQATCLLHLLLEPLDLLLSLLQCRLESFAALAWTPCDRSVAASWRSCVIVTTAAACSSLSWCLLTRCSSNSMFLAMTVLLTR